MVKNPPANAGDTKDMGSIPGLGRSPGVGNGNLLQYSCLESSMDREAWQSMGHKESDLTEQLSTPTQNSYVEILILHVTVLEGASLRSE